ncbi:MAG: hypothetical protein ACRD1D_10295 [Acidimicrobiales bacterium]
MTEPWELLVRQGSQALLEGRFRECERLAGEAARLAPHEPAAGLLAVAARREQGRAAEAEVLLRCVLAEHPESDEGQALLGAVLADLGRDGEARRQLDALDGRLHATPVAALAAEVAAVAGSPQHAAALHDHLAREPDTFAGRAGSVARHLGLLCHVLGRWDQADEHFRAALAANAAAGAPVLVAHTRRQYSALLRVRGRDGDWERAIDLLAEAAATYRRLEIERLAEEAEVVLRRSQDLPLDDDGTTVGNLFRRTAAGWELAYGGRQATVAHDRGLAHIAVLLAAEGRPVHAVELVEHRAEVPVGDQIVAEYRSRVAELEEQLTSPDPEPVDVPLARAERDYLRAELAVLGSGRSSVAELPDRARRLVALRIRTSLDRLDGALPALARHLRRSIRTGTFCVYEPPHHERWRIGP